LLGCGSKSSGGGEESEPFSFEGPFEYTLWGNQKPAYDEETGLLAFEGGSQSMGFIINFADIGYTYNSKDKLIFTYYVEVETPAAAILVKQPSGNNLADPSNYGGAGYGQGKGWEYVLGHDTLSVHTGPLVDGTWDPEIKTGTFEVLMGLFKSSITGIGFQHNPWCDMGGGGKIAENSKYKLKFLKVENGVSEIEVEPPVDPELPETDGTKVTIKVGQRS